MDFTFERGSSDKPRGHALLYFRGADNEATILATYLIVPPVPLNLARYMPPMFAANIPASEAQAISAVPLPPVPEEVESYAYLQQLAEARDDDLLYGGTLDVSDMQRALLTTSEAAQRYLLLYQDFARRLPEVEPEPEQPLALDVNDVLYGLMSENQRLGELAKLTGKLRYAIEGQDGPLIGETVAEMRAIARHLPEKYKVEELIEGAQLPGERGQRLSQLYIDRCYRLFEEDYDSLQAIDAEINKLKSQP